MVATSQEQVQSNLSEKNGMTDVRPRLYMPPWSDVTVTGRSKSADLDAEQVKPACAARRETVDRKSVV